MIHALAWLLERPLLVDDPYVALPAIVILGAPLGPGGTLTAVLAERVAAAVRLYRMGGVEVIIATGGTVHGAPRAEAVAIAEALRTHGIPTMAILVEDAARTTAENAAFSAALLRERAITTAWIVSQPFHGRRAAHLFRRAGIDARIWHITDSLQYVDRGRAVRWLAREYAAWVKLGLTRLRRRAGA